MEHPALCSGWRSEWMSKDKLNETLQGPPSFDLLANVHKDVSEIECSSDVLAEWFTVLASITLDQIDRGLAMSLVVSIASRLCDPPRQPCFSERFGCVCGHDEAACAVDEPELFDFFR